jgi:hypothetical protein
MQGEQIRENKMYKEFRNIACLEEIINAKKYFGLKA